MIENLGESRELPRVHVRRAFGHVPQWRHFRDSRPPIRFDLGGQWGPVHLGRQRLGNLLAKPNQADLLVLKELCETGKVRPVIDRRFPLSEISSAVRYVEDGHARGKVVLTV